MDLHQQRGVSMTLTDALPGARSVVDGLRSVVAEIEDVSSLTALQEIVA